MPGCCDWIGTQFSDTMHEQHGPLWSDSDIHNKTMHSHLQPNYLSVWDRASSAVTVGMTADVTRPITVRARMREWLKNGTCPSWTRTLHVRQPRPGPVTPPSTGVTSVGHLPPQSAESDRTDRREPRSTNPASHGQLLQSCAEDRSGQPAGTSSKMLTLLNVPLTMPTAVKNRNVLPQKLWAAKRVGDATAQKLEIAQKRTIRALSCAGPVLCVESISPGGDTQTQTWSC